MYRIIEEKNEAGVVEEKVCGVLTDFDLASWTVDIKNDRTRTSQQRTGTPPFMAYELLSGSDGPHLYRHDLESLFYIMLILTTHYDIQVPTEEGGWGIADATGIQGVALSRVVRSTIIQGSCFLQARVLFELETSRSVSRLRGLSRLVRDLRLSFRRGIRAKEDHEAW
jgi:serine/threonine protein kinase